MKPFHHERPSRVFAHTLLRGERGEQKPNQLEALRASLKPYEENIFKLHNAYELGDGGQTNFIFQSEYLLQLFPERRNEIKQSELWNVGMELMQPTDTDKASIAARLVQFFPERRSELLKCIDIEELLKKSERVVNEYEDVYSIHFYEELDGWRNYCILFPERNDQLLQKKLFEKINAHPEIVKEWDYDDLADCKIILPGYQWRTIIPEVNIPDPSTEIWHPSMMPDLSRNQRLHTGMMNSFTIGLQRFYSRAVLIAERVSVDSEGLHLGMNPAVQGDAPLPSRSIV